MDYDDYINRLDGTWFTIYNDKFSVQKFNTKVTKGNTEVYVIDNPVEQELFISADMYSKRNYAGSAKCNPKITVLTYLRGDNGYLGSKNYDFIQREGLSATGYFDGQKMPKGKLYYYLKNYKSTPADITVHFYTPKQKVLVSKRRGSQISLANEKLKKS